jgi:hypothetical protein
VVQLAHASGGHVHERESQQKRVHASDRSHRVPTIETVREWAVSAVESGALVSRLESHRAIGRQAAGAERTVEREETRDVMLLYNFGIPSHNLYSILLYRVKSKVIFRA